MYTLARISHHSSATTAKLRVPSGRAPSAVLDGLKARLRASPVRSPRIHRQFDALAAKPGEKSGLASRWMTPTVTVALIGLCLTMVGCGADPPADYGDPTSGPSGIPRMVIVSPPDYAEVETPNIEVRLRLVDVPANVSKVSIQPHGQPEDGGVDPCELNSDEWICRTSVLHGVTPLSLVAHLSDGGQLTWTHHVRYLGDAPGILVVSPAGSATVGKNPVTIQGVVSAPLFQSVHQVLVRAGQKAPVEATLYDDGRFTAPVVLPEGVIVPVRVEATYPGFTTETERWVTQDPVPPTLCLTQPADVVRLSDFVGTLQVSGQALDNTGISAVYIGWAGDELAPVTLASDGTFQMSVAVSPGSQTLVVRALDHAGNAVEKTATVSAPFETVLTLPNTRNDSSFTLTLGASDLKSLIPEADQEDLVLFMLDMEDIVGAALDVMLDPSAFGLSPDQWSPASQNLLQILQMTPETVDLDGTVLKDVTQLAKALGIPVPSMFGKLLDMPITQRFLTRQQLLVAVMENLVKTHPNVVVDPDTGRLSLPVTMRDAFENMEPLNEKLGPVGNHPGLVVPGQVYSKVLTDAFSMELTATSNLILRDGVDLGHGKAYVFHLGQPDVLSFDFMDPNSFRMTGVADYPGVNMVFQMVEAPDFVAAGTLQDGGCIEDGGEEFCRGNSPVWQLAPWSLEYVVADAAFGAFRGLYATAPDPYTLTFGYDIGEVKDAAKVSWYKGWIEIATESNVGSPPPPAYLWDTLLEVAQIRLHDGDIPEGDANASIPLPNVHVPLTAAQVSEQVRPMLTQQASQLSFILAGDHSDYQTECDVYLTADPPTGKLVLWFVGDRDVKPGSKNYPNPSFFGDVRLIQSLGDHVEVATGDELFVADELGTVYQLTIVSAEDSEVSLRVGVVSDEGLAVSGGGCQ